MALLCEEVSRFEVIECKQGGKAYKLHSSVQGDTRYKKAIQKNSVKVGVAEVA